VNSEIKNQILGELLRLLDEKREAWRLYDAAVNRLRDLLSGDPRISEQRAAQDVRDKQMKAWESLNFRLTHILDTYEDELREALREVLPAAGKTDGR
jgi:hypothetical protein